jgi:hypothetical protein
MDKRNKSTLPGLIISKNSTSSLEGIKNAKGSRGSSALPIMKYLGSVKPSRNERIIKPDMTYGNEVIKQDLPTIREVLKPGFSGNFRTNYTLVEQIAVSYLLDIYSGASAAYSVRKLSSTATNSMRVRRSSDNAEQDIGFVGEDLDTASILTFVGANDGFVVTWYDQSGSGLDVTNSTDTEQPKIVSSGVLETQGTQASLVGDGTKHLESSSGFNHSGTLTGIGVKYSDGSPSHAIYQIGAVNEAGNLFSTSTVSTSRNSIGKESVIGVSSIDQHQIQSGFFTNGRQDVWVNGVKGITQSSVAMATATNLPLFIGALSSTVYRFVGSLQEVVLYSSDKTSDLTDIESNINAYYSIY